jgi:hypothetical protein
MGSTMELCMAYAPLIDPASFHLVNEGRMVKYSPVNMTI